MYKLFRIGSIMTIIYNKEANVSFPIKINMEQNIMFLNISIITH